MANPKKHNGPRAARVNQPGFVPNRRDRNRMLKLPTGPTDRGQGTPMTLRELAQTEVGGTALSGRTRSLATGCAGHLGDMNRHPAPAGTPHIALTTAWAPRFYMRR